MSLRNIFWFTCNLLFFVGCSTREIVPPTKSPLLAYPQEVSFLAKNIASQNVAQKDFTQRYYNPWLRNSLKHTKEEAQWANRSYGIKQRYYGENLQLWSDEEIDAIVYNTHFDAYGTLNIHAIMLKNAQMRNLPTHKPFFKKTTLPGEGYPFDYLQTSRIHVAEPILISHYSHDGAWAFVESSFATGWLPIETFVVLDAQKRTHIIDAQKVAITTDNTPLYLPNGRFLSYAKIGTLLPISDEDATTFHTYIFTHDGSFNAAPLAFRVPKTVAQKVPIPFSKETITPIATSLLGEKYGWGGYLENRDCSAMTRDFLTPFGIWVPRNSAAQKSFGEYLSLKSLSNEEKETMILKHGIAFLSLIYLKGHIMLYAGEFQGKPMVVHNTWGVRTLEDGNEGRNVIGKAIVSDLHVGEQQPNVPQDALLIAKVEGMLIRPKDTAPTHPFLKYPSIRDVKENTIFFHDGTTMPYDDKKPKTFTQLLENADIQDHLALPYPAFKPITPPAKDEDPGRFRNDAFLKKLYGETKGAIEKNLTTITWLPNHGGKKLQFNKNENASLQLQKVSNELDKLPEEYMKYLKHVDGTYYYRKIAGTERLSAHSYGIAIDLDTKYSRYWQWDKTYTFHNDIPKEIVDIFEKYGFVWGGRWYHYDTMHFEYRPELFESID